MHDNVAHPTIFARNSICTTTRLAKMPGGLRKILNDIKQMYFGHRYRQCISRCAELLESELQDFHQLVRAYLYFYTALSYDTLARGMHSSSMSRIPALQDAEHHFQKALLELPAPLPVVDHHRARGLFAANLPLSAPTVAFSEFLIFEPRPDNTWSLLPSGNETTDNAPFPVFDPLNSAASTVSHTSTSLGFNAANKPQRSNSAASVLSVLSYQIRRYNEDLAAFTAMIQSHISSVQALRNAHLPPKISLDAPSPSAIYRGTNAYEERRLSICLRADTAKSGRLLSDAEKAARIMRGRERGWAREKFNGKRYEKLCEAALAEL